LAADIRLDRLKREQSMKKEPRGFTLIEMVVVLAVIAILAAVLTPIITSYVERARINAANSDVKNIAAAILQFDTDTKVFPIYKTLADIPNGNTWTVEWSPGDTVALGTTSGPTFADWNLALLAGTSLDGMLNSNALGLPATGTRAWKGAYVNLGADPWGSAYYVTTANLAPSSTNAAYVISAGPNQTIETPLNTTRGATLVPGGDDIVQRIR
jgi:prepilin-type N-terminal cleavage/methylation domain-containing protein